MAKLEYDIADGGQRAQFPAHGWAINSQGVKLLWFPFPCLLETQLKKETLAGKLPIGTHNNVLPFSETLRNLAVALRELHLTVREACALPIGEEVRYEDLRAYEMVPLFADLAFSYLRRLPDLMAYASRPLLFQNWCSAPREFKKWIQKVDRLEEFKPRCDVGKLRTAIQTHSEWFMKLRANSPATGKKGVRDVLEHRRVRLMASKQQSGNSKPRMMLMFDSHDGDVEVRTDLLPLILEATAGFCALMNGVQRSVLSGQKTYEWYGNCFLFGIDDDVVGYWPEITPIF